MLVETLRAHGCATHTPRLSTPNNTSWRMCYISGNRRHPIPAPRNTFLARTAHYPAYLTLIELHRARHNMNDCSGVDLKRRTGTLRTRCLCRTKGHTFTLMKVDLGCLDSQLLWLLFDGLFALEGASFAVLGKGVV